jgi:hypothetical protein
MNHIMSQPLPSADTGRSRYRGSGLLVSGIQRIMRVLPVVVFMWLLSGWALGWW